LQANIKLSAKQLEPGNSVDITVDTKCNSYVGLLGIDQSVDLLKSGEKHFKQIILCLLGVA
jgi:CD109 antigen